ncbi:hypothetical protein SAMN04488498_12077 [Mesorhizobium albiziae]|uniref:Uncharacterized protein n=1 Tax=Neomesorhizobium albiziae TaxID=335020 RepID=A0A1I4DVZ1_9HYPH|nr:antibiotic biosynthesis monooxygenase [Mesorhizobium albiziae]GLS32719.1 hypothetical protein GCM10007937_44290 [Mesorhizobium albiziae]SFK97838.1 hypothetical protein SAMN04488498_12077 [Mesorhizobium albiziae]
MTETQGGPSSVYRINKFTVPTEEREEFLDLLEKTHAVMRAQHGFVRDLILEQQSDPDVCDLFTLIELAGPDAVSRVTAAIADQDRVLGLDRKEIVSRLGIRSSAWLLKAVQLS